MSTSIYTTKRKNGIVVLEFKLPEPITPVIAVQLVDKAPDVSGDILVLSGRGPIWFYAMLIHKYVHVVKAIAIYDSKLGGAIVVATHTPDIKEGEIIKV